MTEYTEALHQISEIHAHLAKGEIYRGYRPLPVALTGLGGLAAGGLQSQVLSISHGYTFVGYWIGLAVLCLVVCGGAILHSYVVRDDEFGRRKTRKVVGQLIPCLVAGVAVTVGILYFSGDLIPLLPGLWTILFSMGIFASRPYLPRAIGWVALFYFLAGCGLLFMAREGLSLSPWGIGGVFGVGQLAAALVLHQNKERVEHG